LPRKPRNLSAEEKALWNTVTRNDTPLKDRGATGPIGALTSGPKKTAPAERMAIPPFDLGAKSSTAMPRHDLAPGLTDSLDATPLRMDRKKHKRLKSGKSEPEGRIDLHGMTTERAHSALTGYIMASQARGLRTVLVITGKGRADKGHDPVPRPHGVLRHEVPRWLSLPPLAQMVLQIVPAHRRHGGSGAYYVHLARRR